MYSSVKETKTPSIDIHPELKEQIKTLTEEESQVIVHIHYKESSFANQLRIWKTTYLFPKESDVSCPLIHFENITLSPEWTEVKPGESLNFTLIFKGLPKDCKAFDLIEVIPQPGAFVANNIQRNQTDVYHLQMSA